MNFSTTRRSLTRVESAARNTLHGKHFILVGGYRWWTQKLLVIRKEYIVFEVVVAGELVVFAVYGEVSCDGDGWSVWGGGVERARQHDEGGRYRGRIRRGGCGICAICSRTCFNHFQL